MTNDFVTIVRGPGGGLALALGTLEAPAPQGRRTCERLVRALARHARREPSPAAVLGWMHALLARWNDFRDEPLLTCSGFFGVVDFAHGVLRYANAEHPRPAAWTRDGHRLTLSCTGEALGLSYLAPCDRRRRKGELCIEEKALTLAGVNRVLCYTQGLAAATSAQPEPDDHALLDLLDATSRLSLGEQVQAVMGVAARSRPFSPSCDASLVGLDVRALRQWAQALN